MATRKRNVKWNSIPEAISSGTLVVTFLDDNSTMTFEVASIPENTREMLLINGIKQKIADSAADPEVDNRAAYAAKYSQLQNGDYNVSRDGMGSGPRMGIFPAAYQLFLAEQGMDLSIEAVRAKIDEKTEAHKAANKEGSWRAGAEKNPRMQELMAELIAKRAKPVSAIATEDLV
jgi:hypothetical protein